MSDLEPGVQLSPDAIAAMERLSASPSKPPMTEIEELRTRIEALEATQHAHVDTSSLWQPARWITPLNGDPSKRLPDPQPDKQPRVFAAEELAPIVAPSPAGSLVGLVEAAIRLGGPLGLEDEARAAILEVAAAALQMHPDKNLTWERVALWLEMEANR
jgi:hypothetical protein